MKAVTTLCSSTIGKKTLMAVTGFVLLGFVIGHMIGNLKLFMGVDPQSGFYKIDLYGKFLREMGMPLVGHGEALLIARLVLLGALVIHVGSAFALVRLRRQARPVPYRAVRLETTDFAARTMWVGGILLLCYVVFHLLHLTTGQAHQHGFVEGHVYANVVSAFHVPALALGYVAAMGVLASHIYHGLWSACQTLNFAQGQMGRILKRVSKVLSLIIFVGYAVVPLAVLAGFVPDPDPRFFLPQGH